MKTCLCCKTEKPLADFYTKKGGRFGVSGRCRLCENDRSRRYQQDHKDVIREQRAEYRATNHASIIDRSRRYTDANREQIYDKNRRYYWANKERRREYNQAWREENRDWLKAYEDRRAPAAYLKNLVYRLQNPQWWRAYMAEYVRMKTAHLKFAQPVWADRKAIRDIYLLCQIFTEATGVPHHVDHIVPLRGKNVCGLHVETNLQILTASDNLAKSNTFTP